MQMTRKRGDSNPTTKKKRTDSELSRTNEPLNWWDAFTRRKTFRCGVLAFIVIFAYLILFLTSSLNDAFSIAGGAVGAVSALFVVMNIGFVQGFNSSTSILFWRTLCDLGLAVRFLLIPAFNIYICGNAECTRSTANESLCPLPSWLFEFFIVSSDCWFICNGLELYTSITNPFSSFSSRIQRYHVFVWSTALLVTLLPFIVDQYSEVYGFWYVSDYHDTSAICWLKVTDNNRLGLPFWFLFVGPLPAVYIFCIFMLIVAHQRLQRGLTRSFLPRFRILVENTANVFISLLYWSVFYIFNSLAFYSRHQDDAYNETLFNMLMFTFGSKGLAAVIVWIFLTDIHSFSRSYQQRDESIDANQALREEVLSFATSGIRSTAKAGATLTPETKQTLRKPVNISSMVEKNLITPTFFLRFLAGQMKEIFILREMVSKKKSSFAPNYVEQPATENKVPFASNPSSASSTTNSSGEKSPFQTQEIPLTDNPLRPSLQEIIKEQEAEEIDLEEGDGTSMAPENSLAGGHRSSVAMGSASEVLAHNESVRPSTAPVFKKKSLVSQVVNGLLKLIGIEINDTIEFLEFEPYHFRQIRLAADISDADYIEYFSTTIKERLTEGGASGAFFFYSKAEKFIAKSCTMEELETLRSNAKAYSDYMVKHQDSYISQIYGIYQLRIYGNYLSFFVMNNLFYNEDGVSMNEKYDIKGSWVSRNAKLPVDGKSVTCSFCEQKFIYRKKVAKLQNTRSDMLLFEKPEGGGVDLFKGQSFSSSPMHQTTAPSPHLSNSGSKPDSLPLELTSQHRGSFIFTASNKCKYTVSGQHEPNLILKDNDIKYKIRLSYENTLHLLRQLRKDVEFLHSLGIMDYSLLVGVHNAEYELKEIVQEVDPSQNEEKGEDRSPTIKTTKTIRTAKEMLSSLSPGQGEDDHSRHSPPPPPPSAALEYRSRRGSKTQTIKSKTKKLEVHKIVGPDSYYVGIIDFQQKWDWNKKLERFFKVTFLGKDPKGLSAIEPGQYKDRFLRKIEDIVDLDSFLNNPAVP